MPKITDKMELNVNMELETIGAYRDVKVQSHRPKGKEKAWEG